MIERTYLHLTKSLRSKYSVSKTSVGRHLLSPTGIHDVYYAWMVTSFMAGNLSGYLAKEVQLYLE